jgi:hypothetical protein
MDCAGKRQLLLGCRMVTLCGKAKAWNASPVAGVVSPFVRTNVFEIACPAAEMWTTHTVVRMPQTTLPA